MVLRRYLHSRSRKVLKKPGLLKGTGIISRSSAIKSLGQKKHFQQTISVSLSQACQYLRFEVESAQPPSEADSDEQLGAKHLPDMHPRVLTPFRLLWPFAPAEVWRWFLGASWLQFCTSLHMLRMHAVQLPWTLCFALAMLRSAWIFPIGFPHNVVANRAPGTPPGPPPGTPLGPPPGTPPGPPPGTSSDAPRFAPMTPPELLEHLVAPGTPEGAWQLTSCHAWEKCLLCFAAAGLQTFAWAVKVYSISLIWVLIALYGS